MNHYLRFSLVNKCSLLRTYLQPQTVIDLVVIPSRLVMQRKCKEKGHMTAFQPHDSNARQRAFFPAPRHPTSNRG